MRKTLGDLAEHIKSVMTPETGGAYAIHPDLTDIISEASVREGVAAFRRFLRRLYDAFIAEGHSYDLAKKTTHGYETRSGTSAYYPFLNHVKNLLLGLGLHGRLSEDARALVMCENPFNPKISASKSLECLRFLAGCGLLFGGVDLGAKKPDLSRVEWLAVSYPEDPAMLAGLKVMAMAEKKFGTLVNWDIFLRCDYRALENGRTDAVSTLTHTIAPLPAGIRDLVMRLHRRSLDSGLDCEAEIKDFWILVKYAYKRKVLWVVNKSLNRGFELSVKAAHTDRYPDAIQTFPPVLREAIARGYGCGRKRPGIGRCDGGCRGLRLPLDESVLGLSDSIETWFDRELVCVTGR